MSPPFLTPIRTPLQIKKKYPLTPFHKQMIHQKREMGAKIMRKGDHRLVILAGPCSIHEREATVQYASLMKKLAKRVEDRIFLIMRVFLEKPRTQFGWKGFIYDPNLDGTCKIEKGLVQTRKLLLELIEMDVPIATEFLDPLLLYYNQDFFTWGIIGARTSASQIHRQMASYLTLPVGFKNETDGRVDNAICGALAARYPQVFVGIDKHGRVSKVKSGGNPDTHLILRGSHLNPNYDADSVSKAIEKQQLHGLSSPLIIDCAHGNSQKNPQKQVEVFDSILDQIVKGNRAIAGAMLESHIRGGNTFSITDPCLDWETTEQLILKAYSMLAPAFCSKNC